VGKGKITSVLGPNGAGKSTLLHTILGAVKPWGGTITFSNLNITNVPTHRKVGMGMALVPEGKHLFSTMSVYENLLMGAFLKNANHHKKESLALVYDLFPRLKERQGQTAGSLSGGEQQMVTIARALMTKPRLLMLDEPSQGLAPKLVSELFETIQKLKEDIGLTILLIEQNADVSLDLSDYIYVMHEGTIKAQGTPESIKDSPEIREAYLGLS
jgi:branched-chain amino acid transport system ATP-binding protein